MKSHIHAQHMVEYAKDAQETPEPWKRWQYRAHQNHPWETCTQHPGWLVAYQYRKKTTRKHTLFGVSVSAPLTALKEPEEVWIIDPASKTGVTSMYFSGDLSDGWKVRLQRGIVFDSEESAIENLNVLFPKKK